VKSFRHETDFVLPDWNSIATKTGLLNSCIELMIYTCHRRGTHAIGGMSAQVPISADPLANTAARQKVRDDTLRHVDAGHDGTLVAHADFVPIAKEVFDAHMKTPNQIQKPPHGVVIGARDLLKTPTGEITENGLRNNVQVAIVYIESWLRGNGWVTIHNKMQDVATAEISISQVWQWLRHQARLNDGCVVDEELVRQAIADEVGTIKKNIGEERYTSSRFDDAAKIFERMITGTEFPEFMPLVAYEYMD
jgi:malate synthase